MTKFEHFTIQILLEAKSSEDYYNSMSKGGQHVNVSPNLSLSAAKLVLRLAKHLEIPSLEYIADTGKWMFKDETHIQD